MITYRLEQPQDAAKVNELIRESFWGQSQPTCDEHYLAHLLRNSSDFLPELTYIAEDEGQIVGSIMYSKAQLKTDTSCVQIASFGPLAVHPAYQNQGIGRQLLTHSLNTAKELGYPIVVIFGEPDYYPKYGFVPAKRYGIQAKEHGELDAFLCYPLSTDESLRSLTGVFCESTVFQQLTAEGVTAFDAQFPKKTPKKMVSIDDFGSKFSQETRTALRASPIHTLADFHFFSRREVQQMLSLSHAEQQVLNQLLKDNHYPEKFPDEK